MSPISRFKASLKNLMRWSGAGGGSWSGSLPGSSYDVVSEAGDLRMNGAVAICLGWIAQNFPEPELQVVRGWRDGVPEPVFGHLLTELIRAPNPHYDGDALLAATAAEYAAHGNAYWVKCRDAAGVVRELWWVPNWMIRPCWPADGSAFISHYVYRVDGREVALPPRDVVHFRFGVDPLNPRVGISPLRPVLREVVSDNQASIYTAALLRNMGIPSVLITGADGASQLTRDDKEALEMQLAALFRGEGAGRALIPDARLRVEKLTLTPDELALEKITMRPEARICGALRLPAQVVGLSVGERTRTFRNYETARRAAYEDCLMPLWRRVAATLDRFLLPELGDPRREKTVWDTTRIAALREDATETYRRNSLAVAGGWMKVSEARARAGLSEDPGQDIYLRHQTGRRDKPRKEAI